MKNITKAIFVISAIVFCVIVVIAIGTMEEVSLPDLMTGKKYYESENHRKEIAKDLNKLAGLLENNRTQTKSGTYEGTFNNSGTKFYNKNVPDELKEVNYTYFFAHYKFYHTSLSFRSDDYDQYEIFNDFYNIFHNDHSLISEDSSYYDAKPSFIFSIKRITEGRNTYIVRNKEIFSHGNYTNDKISFNDLSDYNKGLTDILIIISYSDKYLLNANKNWHKLSVTANILAVVAILTLFYILLYITTAYRPSFIVKSVKFIKRNKYKVSFVVKKLAWFSDIITGKKFNARGASAVEKFIFRYCILFIIIATALFMTYISWYQIILTNTIILIILLAYMLIFIFYHYHAQKLLSYFAVIEKQIAKMYSGCYQIDTGVCKGTAFEKDIDMLAQIGTVFEKNMEDKIKMERTKVELVTNVSHDLKTPLTSIISYIDLLSHDVTLSPEARDYVNILAKKSDRLKHIVNDVFELAMTTSGEIKVENAVLNLNKLIIQTTTDLEDRFSDAFMEARIKIADTDVFISSDGNRLYRIMQNLIDNALKFSLKGTRIYIQEIVSDGKATVKVTNTANYEMDFTKEDVMERFFRGDKSRNSDGSGLGLSIAQGFTIACGGTFDIDINGDQFNAMITFPVLPETVAEELRKAANNA